MTQLALFDLAPRSDGEPGERWVDWLRRRGRWACPGCGAIEPTAFMLALNHGFDANWPGHPPWAWGDRGGCNRTVGTRRAHQGVVAIGTPGAEPWAA